jgi:hypothetical protein
MVALDYLTRVLVDHDRHEHSLEADVSLQSRVLLVAERRK